MNQKQLLHVAMLNSYNLITHHASYDEIIESPIAMFAHLPDEPLNSINMKMLIGYFEKHEMFENCANLKKVYDSRFKPDGTPKDYECQCDYPEIIRYDYDEVRCAKCNDIITR
jgi:hypothetical protein